ncbi:helix-turn-helix domain-containing protein [Weissella minor]|uniref:helix-turn-helix domain-containing protein n=1 Tax=Weissella minor TaxID=1620 RepID=UPI0007103AED|nr:helix-turn-helix transcriptional regulator [Weissella minor]
MVSRLRQLRLDVGETIIYVSKQLKIDPNTLSRYELGKRQPDKEAWIKLANYYDVSLDYLMGRTDE